MSGEVRIAGVVLQPGQPLDQPAPAVLVVLLAAPAPQQFVDGGTVLDVSQYRNSRAGRQELGLEGFD